MNADVFENRLGASISIDFCVSCQVFWFDTRESLQLSPGSVLTLFRTIGEHATGPGARAATSPSCPRCGIRLLETHDMQRTTRFTYRRCPREHGRLITFVNFLREKDFIRPLSAEQIADLRRNVQIVNCSNCGAPIDLAHGASCVHCGSPLSMLDMKQAGALVATLQDAERPKQVDPTLPLRLAQARRDVDAAFAGFEDGPGWFDNVSRNGLVEAGLSSLAQWLKQRS